MTAYRRYVVSLMLRMQKKPQSSVFVTAKGRLSITAESAWSLYSMTVTPLTGSSVLQSWTMPVIIRESIVSPVEKTYVNPGNMLPSLLSAMASMKSRVYVMSGNRSSSKVTSTDLPRSLLLGARAWGGESTILDGALRTTYSSKVKTNLVSWVGTFTDICSGEKDTIRGGMVSLAPPVGAWVVFAHECENSTEPRIRATGTAGTSLGNNLFQFIIYQSSLSSVCRRYGQGSL